MEQLGSHTPFLENGICIDKDGILKLIGHYATQPEATTFRLTYIQEQNDWNLLGIHVAMKKIPLDNNRLSDKKNVLYVENGGRVIFGSSQYNQTSWGAQHLIDCIVNLLFGIGLALLFELAGQAKRFRGLGLGGAILINIVGSLVLISWLLFGSLDIPIKGRMVLWIVGVIVFLIGPITMFWGQKGRFFRHTWQEQRVESSLRPDRYLKLESHRFLMRPIWTSKTMPFGLKTV
jgi:hypothetical protein